jgi:hypothetical protein
VDGSRRGTVADGGSPLRPRLLEGEAMGQHRYKGEMKRSRRCAVSATRA